MILDVNIGMEILVNGNALLGGSHDFEYRKENFNTATNKGDLTTLEPLKQVIVKSPAHTSSLPVLVGAVSYEIDVQLLIARATMCPARFWIASLQWCLMTGRTTFVTR